MGSGLGGKLRGPLLIALLAVGRLGLQLGLGPLQSGQPFGSGGEGAGQLVTTSIPVLEVLGPVGLGGLLEQLSNLLGELAAR